MDELNDKTEVLTVRNAMDLVAALMSMHNIEQKLDSGSWKLIAALTKCRRYFPKAVLLGRVHTDVATLRIDGVTSGPLEIQTGSDGSYEVYADNYCEHGFPGRIIIEIGHPVTEIEPEQTHGN